MAGTSTQPAREQQAPSRPARGAVLAAATLTLMAPAIIAPSLPAMEEVFAGAPGAGLLVRFMLTVTSLAIALSAPVSGGVADRIGRRALLLFGLVLYAVSGTAGFFTTDLYLLLATRVLLGVAVSGIMTAVSATITDWFDGPRRASFLGLQQACTSLGGVVFLPLAGLLATVSWKAPFWIYAASAAVAVFALLALREEPRTERAATPEHQRSPQQSGTGSIVGVYVLAFVATLVFYMAPTQLPFLLGNVGSGPTVIGMVIAGSTLSSMVGALAFPSLRRHLTPTTITTVSVALLGAGWLLVGTAGAVVQIVAGLLVAGAGIGFVVPNLNLRLSELAHPDQRGRVLSGLVTGIFLGQFLSPLVMQPLVQNTGIAGAFVWSGSALAAGAALTAVATRARRARLAPPAAEHSTSSQEQHTRIAEKQRKGRKPMIHHGIRFTLKAGVTPEQREEALESLRIQGRVIPAVRSFVVGRDYGGEYEWGATFVIEDLDGYWEYLMHPAHLHTDRVGLPLVDKFMSFDITDIPDPNTGAKIAALHQRRYDGDPELTQLISDLGEYVGSAAPGPHGK